MTADLSAGAAPREPDGWHAIDWRTATENVRRLQARIVKATKEGRWGKVKALQRLLTHSFSGKALAVKAPSWRALWSVRRLPSSMTTTQH